MDTEIVWPFALPSNIHHQDFYIFAGGLPLLLVRGTTQEIVHFPYSNQAKGNMLPTIIHLLSWQYWKVQSSQVGQIQTL